MSAGAAQGEARHPALLVIDVQQAIDDPTWARHGPRNNPQAEANIAAEVHAMSLANLQGEYASVLTTAQVMSGARRTDPVV